MFGFYFPDPVRRSRYLPWYLKNVLRCALRYGEAWTTSETYGVLFALPPGHTSLSIREYVRNGFLLTPLLLGLHCYRQSMQCKSFVGRTQRELMRSRPHYYLWGLAVDPSQQGKGVGATLMRPLLTRADSEGMPIYLETHEERNVSYYKKHGFDLIHEVSIPKHNVPLWCMQRKPARANGGDAWAHSSPAQ